jgi:hypothetical protein
MLPPRMTMPVLGHVYANLTIDGITARDVKTFPSTASRV